MGLWFIRSQIQLLSSGLHQIGPNLCLECHNGIIPTLAAENARTVRVHEGVCVCVCVCVFLEKREGDGDGEEEEDR